MLLGPTLVVGVLLVGVVVLCRELDGPVTPGGRVLSRKRRFLLFPPGANFIVTVSGGKGSMFETPRGYNVVTEFDMYHPLPDYLYHATSLRLGTVARYPDETTAAPKPTTPRQPTDEQELSDQELHDYLARHPDTWVPPTEWGNDRADWAPLDSLKQHSSTARPVTYQSWKSKLWETTGNDRLYYHNPSVKRERSATGRGHGGDDDEDLSFWTEGNHHHLNISHHRGWDQFHHYRDRRSLYDRLETTIPSLFGFHMRECLLRSICEARNLLPPKGRSMTVDILRVIFTYPLKDELSDEYSRMMRAEKPDCRELFHERCPLSILQFILFGKFEL